MGAFKDIKCQQLFVLLLFFLLVGLHACSLTPENLEIDQSKDLGERRIKRIAILPMEVAKPVTESVRGSSSGSILTSLVYRALNSFPHWELVSEREVTEVETVAQLQEKGVKRAQMVGELVFADAVLYGKVLRFEERVGGAMGAKRPASVIFELNLFDVKRGTVVWRARFNETQKDLSENILALRQFTQRGGRWLTAEELASDGVKKAVGNLHDALYGRS